MKSNNYLPNALMSMAAEDRGGSFGIWLDDRGSPLAAATLRAARFRCGASAVYHVGIASGYNVYQ